MRRQPVWLLLAAWLILGCAPWVLNSYALFVLSIGCILAIGTIGLDITAGMSGQLSLGHAGFFGVGAYAAMIAILRWGFSAWAALPVAVVAASLAAVVIGLPLTRLRGHYLAMATLAFGLIVFDLLYTLREFTGGGAGLALPAPLDPRSVYELLVLGSIATIVVAARLRRSWAGMAWELLRESETAAAAHGIDVALWKLLAVVAGAAFAGLAGAFYVYVVSYVSPEPFGLSTTIFFFAALLIGGPGTVWGPALAALLLNALVYSLGNLLAVQEAIYGAIILIILWLFPGGLAETSWLRRKSARAER
jgi:ABC-type branched-subunit amino acid transport system permease subunit